MPVNDRADHRTSPPSAAGRSTGSAATAAPPGIADKLPVPIEVAGKRRWRRRHVAAWLRGREMKRDGEAVDVLVGRVTRVDAGILDLLQCELLGGQGRRRDRSALERDRCLTVAVADGDVPGRRLVAGSPRIHGEDTVRETGEGGRPVIAGLRADSAAVRADIYDVCAVDRRSAVVLDGDPRDFRRRRGHRNGEASACDL